MRPSCSIALLFACVAVAQDDPLTEAVAILRTSDDAAARATALQALREDVAAAVPLLIDAFGQEQAAPGRVAAALDELGQAAVAPWITVLEQGSPWRRYMAARAVQHLRHDSAHVSTLLRALVPLLGDDDDGTAYLASYVVSVRGHGDAALADALLAQMATAERRACIRTAVTLADLQQGRALSRAALVGALEDSNPGFRFTALKAAHRSGAVDLELWRRAFGDPHNWLRDAAARTPWMLPAADRPAARDALVALLESPMPTEWNDDTMEEWRVRTAAVAASPKLGALAEPLLGAALAGPRPAGPAAAAHTTFVQEACRAAAELGTAAAALAAPLSRVVADAREPATRAAALRALLATQTHAWFAAHADALHDALLAAVAVGHDTARVTLVGAACGCLARCGEAGRGALATLRGLADDPACAAHAAAAELAIAGTGGEVLARVRVALASPPSQVSGHVELCAAIATCAAAARALAEPVAKLGEVGSAPPEVRVAATATLGHLAAAMRADDPEQADVLTRRLAARFADRWLADAAPRAAAIADPAWGERLIREHSIPDAHGRVLRASVRQQPARFVPLLDDASEPVRSRAASLLGDAGPAATEPLLAFVRDGQPRHRYEVLRCLHALDDPAPFLPALQRWSKDTAVENWLIGVLGRIGPAAAPTLLDMVTLDNVGQYVPFVNGLDAARETFVPKLVELAATTQDPKQLEAVAALLLGCGPRGLEAARRLPLPADRLHAQLIVLAQSDDNATALAAAQALASERVAAPGASQRITRHRDSIEHLDRWIVALATIDPASDATASVLELALAQPSASLRRDAIRLLAPHATEAVRGFVAAKLHVAEFDPDEGVRAAASAARAALRDR